VRGFARTPPPTTFISPISSHKSAASDFFAKTKNKVKNQPRTPVKEKEKKGKNRPHLNLLIFKGD
jgi:hypothetical protein